MILEHMLIQAYLELKIYKKQVQCALHMLLLGACVQELSAKKACKTQTPGDTTAECADSREDD